MSRTERVDPFAERAKSSEPGPVKEVKPIAEKICEPCNAKREAAAPSPESIARDLEVIRRAKEQATAPVPAIKTPKTNKQLWQEYRAARKKR